MRTTVRTTVKDRAYMTPFIIGGLLLLSLFILGIISIRSSELQVPVRYTSFGVTNFYTEPWFYQLSFMLFGAVVYILHGFVGVQIYKKKGDKFATSFQWFTVVIMLITLLTTYAIFRIADLS